MERREREREREFTLERLLRYEAFDARGGVEGTVFTRFTSLKPVQTVLREREREKERENHTCLIIRAIVH